MCMPDTLFEGWPGPSTRKRVEQQATQAINRTGPWLHVPWPHVPECVGHKRKPMERMKKMMMVFLHF